MWLIDYEILMTILTVGITLNETLSIKTQNVKF